MVLIKKPLYHDNWLFKSLYCEIYKCEDTVKLLSIDKATVEVVRTDVGLISEITQI